MSLLDLVQAPAPSVSAAATVQKSVASFRKWKTGALLVLDKGQMVGILSERDLVHRVVGNGLDPRTTIVAEAMTPHVETVAFDATVEHAYATMTARRIRHMAVVNRRGRPVGLLSLRRVAKARIESAADQMETLEQFVTADGPGG